MLTHANHTVLCLSIPNKPPVYLYVKKIFPNNVDLGHLEE